MIGRSVGRRLFVRVFIRSCTCSFVHLFVRVFSRSCYRFLFLFESYYKRHKDSQRPQTPAHTQGRRLDLEYMPRQALDPTCPGVETVPAI